MRDEPRLRVLVVDDDPVQLELVERMLKLDGFEVATASAAIGVTSMVRSFQPNVVLFDANMPALPGHLLLGIVRRHAAPTVKLVLFSAVDESKLRQLAADAKADDWISKSSGATALARRIRQICRTDRSSPDGSRP
jgi:DNA-binding response OmpR family regulator